MTDTLRVPHDSLASAPRRASGRRLAWLATGIAGLTLLGGCSNQAHHPDKMAQESRDALSRGQTPRAIALAEQAVQADGRNPALRLTLANAYLRAGRFESARQAFSDAIALGDDSSRAAIGLVLSDLALGHNSAALDTINTYGDVLPAADLGLGLAMAGQNQRAIEVLTNAIRQGQNVPKVRQNLAFAYALSGMWDSAKIMAAQDVPADQVNDRLQSWAAMARPEDARRRVASLVGAPLIGDTGQPAALALARFPANPGDKEASAPQQAAAVAPAAELPPTQPVQAAYPSGALARIELTPSTAPTMVSHPVVEPLPASRPAPAPVVHAAPARRAVAVAAPAAAPVHGLGSHLVQLGAFNSEESARRAWQHFVARDARLQGHPDLISKVNVRGREFWRLQAAGFAGQASAASLCGSMRAHGGACLVMAVNAASRVNPVQTADSRPAHAAPQRPVLQPVAAHPAPIRPAKDARTALNTR